MAIPALLHDPAAKSAYDRLAAGKFAEHDCAAHPARMPSYEPPSFTERMRMLVSKGFKPKDAVDIVLEEVHLEHRGNARMLENAAGEAQDFLRRVREGLI